MSKPILPDDDTPASLQQLLADALKPVAFDSTRSDALRARLLARARASHRSRRAAHTRALRRRKLGARGRRRARQAAE
jgi:hypothetical protein